MRTDIYIEGQGDLNALYMPAEKGKACIIMIHGVGEHIGRYLGMAGYFNSYHYSFIGVDLPGHGKSPGRKGHIRNISIYGNIIDTLINYVIEREGEIPLILYGHSMGGGIALRYLIDNDNISRAIISSPWIKLSFDPPKYKLLLASIMGKIAPAFIQPSGLDPIDISTDINVVNDYRSDPLIHYSISVGLYLSARDNGMDLLERKNEIKTPVLLMHSIKDRITSPAASSEFAGNNNMVDLKLWDEGLHELHNEVFREELLAFVINWLEEHDETKNRN